MYSHTLDALKGTPSSGAGCPIPSLDPKDIQWLDRLTLDGAVGIFQGWCCFLEDCAVVCFSSVDRTVEVYIFEDCTVIFLS